MPTFRHFQTVPLSQSSAELVLGLCSDSQNLRRFCMESSRVSMSPSILSCDEDTGTTYEGLQEQEGTWGKL